MFAHMWRKRRLLPTSASVEPLQLWELSAYISRTHMSYSESSYALLLVVSYKSITVQSSLLFNWAFFSALSHLFLFDLKRSLREWNVSALWSIPASKRFQRCRSDGTGRSIGSSTLHTWDIDITYQCEPTSSNWNGSCVHQAPPVDEPETYHGCFVRHCWVVPTRSQWFLHPPALLQGYSLVNIWVSMNPDGHEYERGQSQFEAPGGWIEWAQGFFPPASESELHIDTWYHTSPRLQGCLPYGMKGLCRGYSPCWSAWKGRSFVLRHLIVKT